MKPLTKTQLRHLRQQLWDRRGVGITAPCVAILMIGLRLLGWFQPFEWAWLDLYFRWRGSEAIDPRVILVGVTEKDLQEIGRIPVPDGFMAQALDKIRRQKPRAIGLDFYRDLPVEPGHAELVKIFQSTPNLIGIEKKVGDMYSAAVAPPPALKALGQVAANDQPIDSDGRIRRGLLVLETEDGDIIESLGLRLALLYLEGEGIVPSPDSPELQLGKAIYPHFEANTGGYVRADAAGYQLLMNYRGPAQYFPRVSLMDILEDKIPPDLFREKVVLVGPMAASLNDFFYTPFSKSFSISPEQMTGVEVQANLTSQIISAAIDGRALLKTWSDGLEGVWIVLWVVLGTILSWLYRSPLQIIGGTVLVGSFLVSVGYGGFLWGGWWIPIFPAIAAFLVAVAVNTIYIAAAERQDRQVLMTLFSKHVNAEIVDMIWQERRQLMEKGRLVARKMTATVMFTDIRNFTQRSEEADPEELISWLNEYTSVMTEVALAHSGVVEKFIGDGMMIVFGVPLGAETEAEVALNAQLAVQCALAMAKALKTLNQQWIAQQRPSVAMRMGIATGVVVSGSLGSTQRLEYTTLGDCVNVASRLESYEKSMEFGCCRILINEETYQHLKAFDQPLPTHFLGTVFLKGRQQPTLIYQVLTDDTTLVLT